MSEPQIKNDDPLYRLLREGHIQEFNEAKAKGQSTDLTNCDFRSINLTGLDAAGLNLSGCYFRQADLRGIDFTSTNLEGASIHGAKISGTFFPKKIAPKEIDLSFLHGTRMRYR
ncbi:MAG: pentapeptide repeat-containing protein [Gammaproteobacteria bacterium]